MTPAQRKAVNNVISGNVPVHDDGGVTDDHTHHHDDAIVHHDDTTRHDDHTTHDDSTTGSPSHGGHGLEIAIIVIALLAAVGAGVAGVWYYRKTHSTSNSLLSLSGGGSQHAVVDVGPAGDTAYAQLR